MDLKDAAPKLKHIDPELAELWIHFKDCIILFQRIMPIVERLVKPKISEDSFLLYNRFVQLLQKNDF